MKIAIVHDWLTGLRGGEKVLLAILELFGDTDIYTIVHKKKSLPEEIEKNNIFTSFINKLPFGKTKYQKYLPLMPFAIEQFDLSKYDVVLSISHCVAKSVITRYDTLHISYVNSPMRYAYEFYNDYFGDKKFITKTLISYFMNYIRIWDVASSNRVDYFIANSENIKKRIKKHYRRDSFVIYPPVDIDKYKISSKRDNYYFILSALVEYKRIDLAVAAFNELGLPLIIAGKGVQLSKLKKMAKKNIEFVGDLSQEKIVEYYSKAKAFIFPGEEDFGITPVEAQASGIPVIAYQKGGVLETVIARNYPDISYRNELKYMTGIFFNKQEVNELIGAVKKYEEFYGEFNPDFLRSSVMKFDKQNFKANFKNYFEFCLKNFREGNLC